MAEKVISPGVFTSEVDQTFLPAAVGDIGAALIGPTVKGPAMVPTVVSSYAEYQAIFGDTVESGSKTFQFLTSHAAQEYLKHSNSLTVVRILDGTFQGATANVLTASNAAGGKAYTGSYGKSGTQNADVDAHTFKLHTLADGAIMNNSGSAGTNMLLTNGGSADNVRYEITSVNRTKGTFTLLIRRGNDTHNRKQVLETFNNVSLDPNANNYIAKAVGDSYLSIQGTDDEPYLQYVGTYPPKSKYVRVEVLKNTIDYLDENGNIRSSAASASLPAPGSGSQYGAFANGDNGVAGFNSTGVTSGSAAQAAYMFYDKIAAAGSQGFVLSSGADGTNAYKKALSLLSNADEFDINMIMLPGIIDSLGGGHTATITKAIQVCEDRGDCFLVYDTVPHNTSTISTVTGKAAERDTNYAATYWPWVQIQDSQVGTLRWVPPSVVIPSVYAFNDKVAQPWFAPAGLNRGGIDIAVQAERKLTQSNRDDLYDANVNPIATFPGQGVVVFGQKTLQKKASSLDRVNVRRLLIRVKKFIAASSRFLVFEQNTQQTRNRFLNIANPYLEQVQSQSGLSAFRVVMDETNNTPDTVDRNQLVGQLFLQPTRTAEFIILDFTVQPTGATFPE
tara:strand:- start:12776 stop:14629 length:1854 start_codon:yes stop_codon:yes gene_type:complete